MTDIAIRVENCILSVGEGLGKQYHIGGPQQRYKTLRESLVGAPAEYLEADVSSKVVRIVLGYLHHDAGCRKSSALW